MHEDDYWDDERHDSGCLVPALAMLVVFAGAVFGVVYVLARHAH